jgi:hypothetical protein
MVRPRIYADRGDKQRAYRERVRKRVDRIEAEVAALRAENRSLQRRRQKTPKKAG